MRHPNSQRFHDLLAEAADLHDMKQGDYGRDEDPFANVRASEDWNVPAWVGAMVRLTDKVRRLQSLARRGSLNNEAAIDSFMDIAVYALIARILYEETIPPIPGAFTPGGALRLVAEANLERAVGKLADTGALMREAIEASVTEAELERMAHEEWSERAQADAERLAA